MTGAAAALLGAAANEPGLHTIASRRGRFFGTAVDHSTLSGDPAALSHVPIECGIVVGENSFKWAELRPRPDAFAYEQADMLVAYAARNRLLVRGHNLVWSEFNPDWLVKSLTPDNAERLLTTHIRQVAGHFRGRLVHWDVVNEVVQPDHHQTLGLANTLWFKALGPRFIDIAFHACAAADPHALRVLNDYGLDYAIPWQDRKRGAVLDLLADLTKRRVPVQALGIQGHLDASETHLDQKILERFCADVASMGLKLIITEMDVSDRGLPADIAVRDAAVAAHGRAYLEAVLPNPNMLGVLTWGLTDRRSWLNDSLPRPDGLPQRPLPLDRDLQRKPLWHAIANAMN